MNIFTFVAAQLPDHDAPTSARYWSALAFISANLPGFALVSRAVFAKPHVAATAASCVAFGVPNVRRNVCEVIAYDAAL